MIKVYGFKGSGQGIMEVENTLEAEQAFVGGLIDVNSVTKYLDLVFNDEGLVNGLEVRAVVFGDGEIINKRNIHAVIQGDCFVCRHNEKGDFVSIEDDDIETIKHYVKAVMPVCDGVIAIV